MRSFLRLGPFCGSVHFSYHGFALRGCLAALMAAGRAAVDEPDFHARNLGSGRIHARWVVSRLGSCGLHDVSFAWLAEETVNILTS